MMQEQPLLAEAGRFRVLAVAQTADLHQFQAQRLNLGQHPEQGSLISQSP